jgi:hypothetical protein
MDMGWAMKLAAFLLLAATLGPMLVQVFPTLVRVF